jgi:hypothetical protein
MRSLYNYCFAARYSHITTVYKLIQKLETKIEIFPVDDHRAVRHCPAVRRSRGQARGGGVGSIACGGARMRVAARRRLRTRRGRPRLESRRRRRRRRSGGGGIVAVAEAGVEAPAGITRRRPRVVCHGARRQEAWSSAAALAMEREAEAELLSLTRLPPCLLSSLTAPPPPQRPRVPCCSSCVAGAPKLLRRRPSPSGRPLLPF